MNAPKMTRLPYSAELTPVTPPCRWLLLAPGDQPRIYATQAEANMARLEAVVREFDPVEFQVFTRWLVSAARRRAAEDAPFPGSALFGDSVGAIKSDKTRKFWHLPMSASVYPLDGAGETVAIARDPDGGVRLLHAFPDAKTARAQILDRVHDSLCGDMCEGEEHRIKVSVETFTAAVK